MTDAIRLKSIGVFLLCYKAYLLKMITIHENVNKSVKRLITSE